MDVSRKPRILLFNEFGSLNGGERSLLAVLPHLRERFQFIAAVPCPSPLAQRLQDLQIDLLPLALKSSGEQNNEGENDRHLVDLIERASPDLVHANSLQMSRRLGRICDRLRGPCIGHIRDIVRLSKKAVGDLNRLSKLIFVSAVTRDCYLSQGVDATKGCVVFNGVDLEIFQPRQPTGFIHRELGLPEQAPLLLAIGQMGMRKGLDVLFDAFERVRERHPQIHLMIVGQRYSGKDEAIEYEQSLLLRADSAVLRGYVHFLGRRDDVHLLMNEATLLVHAAREEPLGRVLLEACASGLPVVATNVGGTSEIFPEGREAAVLVPKNDSESMSSAIIKLLFDDARLGVLARSARKRATECFDAGMAVTHLAQIYGEMLEAECF